MMESTNFIVNDYQTEVTPQEDEDYNINGHNVEKGIADIIQNNVQITEEDVDLDDDEDNASERK